MVCRQPSTRHRGTGRHLRLANGVHAGEQGLRTQRGLGDGPTTADLDGHFDLAKLVFVLRKIHLISRERWCRQQLGDPRQHVPDCERHEKHNRPPSSLPRDRFGELLVVVNRGAA